MRAGGEPASGPAIDSERARPFARLLACCMLAGLLGSWACIAGADTTLSADIRPQPVADALAEFAHQTRLQFIYVSKIVKARVSPGAHAGQTATEALPLLLGGTGLDFAFLNSRTVRIFESGAAAPTAQANATDVPKTGFNRREPLSIGPDEVVVTGLRSADDLGNVEDVQSIAASVSVVGGDTLEAQKLEQLSDYAASLPGVNVVSYGAPGSSQVLLRGISSFVCGAAAAFYFDDTPIGRSGPHTSTCFNVLDLMPYDLERFEVRRGPQGTHYGANSESGLVRYVLQRPNLSVFEARVGADASAIRGASGTGASMRVMVNAPIVEDELAVRASAYDSYTPGYIDNAYTGATDVNAAHQTGGRVALLWRPADSVSVKVNAFWPRIDSDSEADVSSRSVTVVPGTGDANVVKGSGSYGDLTDYHAFLQPFRKAIDYYSATVEWNPGALEVLSATGWSSTRTDYVFDESFFYGPIFPAWSGDKFAPSLEALHQNNDVEQFTEEIHVTSRAGTRFGWLLGAFYNHERVTEDWALYAYDTSYQPMEEFAPALSLTTVRDTFSELAAFGELTWHATDRIDLTGGIRYTRNDQQFSSRDSGIYGVVYVSDDRTEGVTTSMLAASDRIAPGVMLYGRVATGSQPPTFSGVILQDDPSNAKPETVTNYEIGLKSEFPDRLALIDLSVFYMNWRDVELGVCFAGGCGNENAGNATSQGIELASSWSPLQGLTVGYNAAYIKSELTSAVPGSPSLPGYQLANIPKWSMALTANYDWALTDAWNAHAGGAMRWIGQRWSANGVQSRLAGGAPTRELPAYSVLDLNASVAKGPLVLRVFMRNVTDTLGGQQGNFQGYLYYPPLDLRILQPRTIGVGFDYSF